MKARISQQTSYYLKMALSVVSLLSLVVLISILTSSCTNESRVRSIDFYSQDAGSAWRVYEYSFSLGDSRQKEGSFEYRPGKSVLLAAPHNPFDKNTGRIVKDLCQRLKDISCLVANDFRLATNNSYQHNVNRPTRLNIDNCDNPNPWSNVIYEEYARFIEDGEVSLYVEIHGNSRERSKGFIEIAVKGIDSEVVKSSFVGYPTKVEGKESLFYRASEAKKCGSLAVVDQAVHIELEKKLRVIGTDEYNAMLSVLESGIKRLSSSLGS